MKLLILFTSRIYTVSITVISAMSGAIIGSTSGFVKKYIILFLIKKIIYFKE